MTKPAPITTRDLLALPDDVIPHRNAYLSDQERCHLERFQGMAISYLPPTCDGLSAIGQLLGTLDTDDQADLVQPLGWLIQQLAEQIKWVNEGLQQAHVRLSRDKAACEAQGNAQGVAP